MVDKVTVQVVADSQPFAAGMDAAVASAQSGATAISSSMQGLLGSTTVAFGQATAAVQDYIGTFPKTVEGAVAVAAAIEKQNIALLQQAAAEETAMAAQRARIQSMVQASLAEQAANAANAASQRVVNEARIEAALAAEGTSIAEQQLIRWRESNIAATETEVVAVAADTTAKTVNTAATVSNTVATEANAAAHMSSRTSYELGVAASEVLSGNYARLERTAAALGNSTGFLQKMMTGSGLAMLGAGVAVFELANLMVKGSHEMEAFNQALLTSDQYSKTAAGGLMDVAHAIAATGVNTTAAKEAVLSLAQTGKFFGETFDESAKGIAEWSAVSGKSIQDVTRWFVELQDKPYEASLKLQASLHFTNQQTLDYIHTLESEGQKAAAAQVAIEELATAGHTRFVTLKEDEGYIARFFDYEVDGWSRVKDSIMSIEQAATPMDQVVKARQAYNDALVQYNSLSPALQAMDTEQWQNLNRTYAALVKAIQGYKDLGHAKAEAGAQAALDRQTGDDSKYFNQLADSLTKQAGSYHQTKAAMVEYDVEQRISAETAGKSAAEAEVVERRIRAQAQAALDAAQLMDGKAAADKSAAAATRDLHKELTQYNEALKLNEGLETTAQSIADQFIAKSDPVTAAWAKQAAQMLRLVEADDKIIDNDDRMIANATTLADKTAAQAKLEDDLVTIREREFQTGSALVAQTQQHIAALGDWNTIMEKVQGQYVKDQFNESLTTGQRRIAVEVEKAETEALKLLQKQQGEGAQLSEDEKKQLESIAAAHVKTMEAIEAHKKAMEEWQQIVTGGFDSVGKTIADFVTGGIKSWKDFGKALVNDAKQFIGQVIAEFLRLQVFNGIINGLFGSNLPTGMSGGGGLLGAGIQAASGGSSGGLISGLFGDNAGNGMLSNAIGGANSGNGLMGFLFGGGGATDLGGAGVLAGQGAFAGSVAEGAGGYAGYLGDLGDYGTATGGMSAAGGSGGMGLSGALSIAGGVVAGVGEFQNAGGGAMGVLGGAAYGIGTVMAAGAISGALGLGAGAAVGGGLAGAAAGGTAAAGSIGLAAIPVIGWIALAAMLIDKFSGGKLFGTEGKVVGGNQTETIDSAGVADVVTNITKKGQHAFFGGAYWKESQVATDPAVSSGADTFATALKNSTFEFAHFFGETLTSIVGGKFETMFDKKGKQTGTTETINGVTIKGETGEQFGERLQAANYLKVLDQLGLGASEFVKGLQGDADKLFAAVKDFAATAQAAYTNINNGFRFMALSADQTLPQVIEFVKGLQQGGETLSQTYQRLAQAQMQYNQFTAQFKPGTVYIDDYEAGLSKINDAMHQNEAQANALAIASGAAGANQEDLTNIQNHAAQQAAQLTAQLEASAQQLAFALGLTLQGSMAQITDEISRLESKAGGGTSSIQNFGNTMTTVAKQATDAVNLMLGNLSPYNDQQKLQIALQGLRAGTVSQEQVLSIGRNLYASSQPYTDLFNMVMQYPGSSGGTGGSTVVGGGGSTTTSGQGLTPEEQTRLDALRKEQDVLKGAATAQQFQTLAQQIQEIANAKNETYSQVIAEMGINLKDLEKGLSIKNDADFAAYMTKLQQQVDSAGNNTQSIVLAIIGLPNKIYDAFANGGKDGLTSGGTITPGPKLGGAPQVAPSGNGNSMYLRSGNDGAVTVALTPDSAAMLAEAIVSSGKRLQDNVNRDVPRSGRSRFGGFIGVN
jgi:phage-related minor tail protein